MKFFDYKTFVVGLKSNPDEAHLRLRQMGWMDTLHAALGIATEAGEILDRVKKEVFYAAEPDPTNIKEELGDLMWYVTLMCYVYGLDLDDVIDANVRKLKTRYPQGFKNEDALTRDLKAEEQAMKPAPKLEKIPDPLEEVKKVPIQSLEMEPQGVRDLFSYLNTSNEDRAACVIKYRDGTPPHRLDQPNGVIPEELLNRLVDLKLVSRTETMISTIWSVHREPEGCVHCGGGHS